MKFSIGDWITLDKLNLANDNIFEMESKIDIFGIIKDVDKKSKIYTIDIGKKNGFYWVEEEIWVNLQYRKATANEIKKEMIKRAFIKKN
jgi:hypothetical protein